ncbi:Cell surface glycoprotein [uncultured archaeon]|nr:Cell surface glycoprotein [uncultured archaeon]
MQLNDIGGKSVLRIGLEITVIVLLLVVGASAAKIKVCKIGTCDYSTIQDAISAASPGDIITVHSGTYYENVNVNKQLTLSGLDTGGGKPAVNAGGSGSAITLSADGITLKGFTAVNGLNGILLYWSNDNILSGNNASNNYLDGISLDTSFRNTLTGNTAVSNGVGISLGSTMPGGLSNDNMLIDNYASNNTWSGISVYHHSMNNSLIGNNASNNAKGISLENQCVNNTVNYNKVSNNIDGISIDVCWRNTLSGNFVTGNSNGIVLHSDASDPIGSNGNRIYNNYFKNTINAIDGNTGNAYLGNNTWNIAKTLGRNIIGGPYLGGNYWSDYDGIDTDGDGLGDNKLPHDSSNGIVNGGDYLPLTPLVPIPPVPELPPIALTSLGLLGLLVITKKNN